MKQLPLPAHPVFPSRLDSIAALPELLRSRQIGCVLVIGDAHAVDCESLLLPVLEDSQIMYAVHAAVSLSDSKEGALTRTDVDTALQAFTDKQAQAILAVGGNDAMALGQALLARLHTKGYAETFEQWRAIPLILLPAAADASAVFAETGDVFDPVRGKSRRFSLRAHTSRYVLMDDAMLALQSRESLLRTGIWTIAHAICAGMSRLLPREERQKAENALRSLTGQLIAVSDDAAVPESERFSSDLASRRALHTASLDAAEAFAVSHDAVLPALLNALTTVKQLSPDETLSLLLAPMIAQSEGTRRKALSDMAIGAGLCVADADGAAALAAWVRDLVFHAGYGLTLPTLYHRDIPAVARIAAQDTLLNRFALEDILRAIMTPDAPHADIAALFAAQKACFASGITRPVPHRLDQLRRLRRAILAHEQDIEAALQSDLGKCRTEAYMCEIGMVLSELGYLLRRTRRYCRDTHVLTPLAQFPARSFIRHDPMGVVLIMSPWNYPFLLTIEPLLGALAGGNCCILKPSKDAPATSAIIRQICAECFPLEEVAVVEGGRTENQALLDQPFDKIFFTGSSHVGQEVLRRAAEHLTPATLELGGKSPSIVDRGADIEVAARRIAWGKTLNAGQTCIAPDYLLIHRSLQDEFSRAFARALHRLHGDDAQQSLHYGRLVNDRAFERVTSYLAQGKILVGGRTDPSDRYIEPTLLAEVDPGAPVMQEEIFGPVLPMLPFDDIGEAVALINDREKPLALYYFGPEKTGREVLLHTSSGGACINDTIMQIANDRLPFGGVGNSGMGRYHGHDSFDAFSLRRGVVESPARPDLPLRYPPYKGFRWVKKIL